MKNDSYRLLVAGGGAAGLMAAGTAARLGASVLLIEKNRQPGRKLLITGKGRCNLTNDCTGEDFLQNIPTNPKFLYSAIRRFSTQDTKAFFEALGVPLKTERGNRVFPVSDKARDIVDALVEFCRQGGVERTAGRVESLLLEEGTLKGVRCEDGRTFRADALILATGGMSYPLTGSTGDGYALARSAGHTVSEIRPSLVPLTSPDPDCAALQGLSLRNVEAALFHRKTGKILYKELGELLFTHFGLSGPLILSASAHIPHMDPDAYGIRIDLKPGLTAAQLDARLLRDFGVFANRNFCNSLEKLLPQKLIPVVVERSGIPPMEKVNQISRSQRETLVRLLKCLEFPVDGFRPIEEAIVTSGGVSVKEIHPATMESRLCPGLYFVGELIDVDGYTGGFNLQIAFSTGFAAGTAAAQKTDSSHF